MTEADALGIWRLCFEFGRSDRARGVPRDQCPFELPLLAEPWRQGWDDMEKTLAMLSKGPVNSHHWR